jgi:hypothetical protein
LEDDVEEVLLDWEDEVEDVVEEVPLVDVVELTRPLVVGPGGMLVPPVLCASLVLGATDSIKEPVLVGTAVMVPRTLRGSALVELRIGSGVADDNPVSRAKTLPTATAHVRIEADSNSARRNCVNVDLAP